MTRSLKQSPARALATSPPVRLSRLLLSLVAAWGAVPAAYAACTPGSYFDGTACVLAPAGTYTNSDTATAPTAASLGYFVPSAGATIPFHAQLGYYVPLAAAVSQTPAGLGYFVNTTAALSRTAASLGYYVDTSTASTQTAAGLGYFVQASAATARTAASVGYYVNTSTASTQTAAGLGYFVDTAAASSRTAASPGYYVDTSTASSQKAASPGYFVSTSAASSQTPAGAGYFVADIAASTATAAPAGFYVTSSAAVAAVPASAGYYVPTTAASSQTAASVGYYVASAGASSQTAASLGYFVDSSAALSQTAASLGYFVDTVAATVAKAAPEGYYVPAAAATLAQLANYSYFSGQTAATEQPLLDDGTLGASRTPLTLGGRSLVLRQSLSSSRAIDLGGGLAAVEVPAGSLVQLQGSWTAGTSLNKSGAGQLSVTQLLAANVSVQAGRMALAAGASGSVSVAQGASLQVQGSVASLNNQGTVEVSGGTLQVQGAFTHQAGAVLQLTRTGAAQAPLQISGTANLGGKLVYRLATTPLSTGSSPLIAFAGGSQGQFSSIETDLNPVGFSLTPVMSNTGLRIDIAARDLAQAVTGQMAQSVARALDAARSSGPAELTRVIEQIAAAPASVAEATLQSLTARASLGAAVMQVQLGQQMARETQTLGFESSAAAPSSSLMPRLALDQGPKTMGTRFWASAPVWRSQFDAAGSTQRMAYQGASAGTDTVINARGDRIGLSVSIFDQTSQSDDFQSKGSSRQASLYGLSPVGPFQLSYSLGLGGANTQQTRWIRLPDQTVVAARSSPQDRSTQASAGLSLPFDLNAQVKMEPFVRVSWRKQQRDAYSEVGAGGLGLQMSTYKGQSHSSTLGWRWSGTLSGWSGRNLHWASHWEWTRNTDRFPAIEQRFINTQTLVNTQGIDAQSNAPMVSLSLRQELQRNSDIGMSLSLDQFHGQWGRGLTMSYRKAW